MPVRNTGMTEYEQAVYPGHQRDWIFGIGHAYLADISE
jgi:hypothetical protein